MQMVAWATLRNARYEETMCNTLHACSALLKILMTLIEADAATPKLINEASCVGPVTHYE